MNINGMFEGVLDVDIEAQQIVTRAQRRLIHDAFGDGVDVAQEVRFACRIATDVNKAIENGIEFDNGKTFVPNPKARAQFGKNKRGKPYLTFGLVDVDSGERFTLTWEGAAVPLSMVRAAIAHDEGRNVKASTVELPFESAKVHETGNKYGRKKPDPRPNHDTDADGNPYPRPKRRQHSRMCRSDLDTLKALRKSMYMRKGRG